MHLALSLVLFAFHRGAPLKQLGLFHHEHWVKDHHCSRLGDANALLADSFGLLDLGIFLLNSGGLIAYQPHRSQKVLLFLARSRQKTLQIDAAGATFTAGRIFKIAD